jgi:hypothetical protein
MANPPCEQLHQQRASMATEPKSVREVNVVLEGILKQFELFQKSIEARFDFLRNIVWVVIGLLGALLAGAFALSNQIGEIKTDVALLKSQSSEFTQKQTAVLESLKSTAEGALARVENRLASLTTGQGLQQTSNLEEPLKLSRLDTLLIRSLLKPVKTGRPLEIKVGDEVKEVISADRVSIIPTIAPLPAELTDEVTKFKGLSFAYDPSGAVLIVSPSRRVVAIIES